MKTESVLWTEVIPLLSEKVSSLPCSDLVSADIELEVPLCSASACPNPVARYLRGGIEHRTELGMNPFICSSHWFSKDFFLATRKWRNLFFTMEVFPERPGQLRKDMKDQRQCKGEFLILIPGLGFRFDTNLKSTALKDSAINFLVSGKDGFVHTKWMIREGEGRWDYRYAMVIFLIAPLLRNKDCRKATVKHHLMVFK